MSRDPLAPVVTAYLTTILQPALGKDLGGRSKQELRTLAECLDAMLKGDMSAAADMLVGRFLAVEQSEHDQHWNVARHMELVRSQEVSAVPEDLLERAVTAERRDARLEAARKMIRK